VFLDDVNKFLTAERLQEGFYYLSVRDAMT